MLCEFVNLYEKLRFAKANCTDENVDSVVHILMVSLCTLPANAGITALMAKHICTEQGRTQYSKLKSGFAPLV